MSAMSERAAVIDQLITDLPAEDLKALAERLASEVGYVLEAEPAHPDGPTRDANVAPVGFVLQVQEAVERIGQTVAKYERANCYEVSGFALADLRTILDALASITRERDEAREGLRQIKGRTYSDSRSCALKADAVAEIYDIAAALVNWEASDAS